jgi:hypothetical protein
MTYPASGGIYASCLVPDAGYDVEIELPWSVPWLDAGAPPVRGDSIGFDLAVDVKTSGGNEVQSFAYVGPAPEGGAPNECVQIAKPEAPYCDDRCCCRPIVQ